MLSQEINGDTKRLLELMEHVRYRREAVFMIRHLMDATLPPMPAMASPTWPKVPMHPRTSRTPSMYLTRIEERSKSWTLGTVWAQFGHSKTHPKMRQFDKPLIFIGAGRGGRTPTRLPSADFESPSPLVISLEIPLFSEISMFRCV